jgi:hypothetical protein
MEGYLLESLKRPPESWNRITGQDAFGDIMHLLTALELIVFSE